MNDAIAALADIPLYRGVDPARLLITPLGGLSNRSFRVAGPVGVHVLRLAGAAAISVASSSMAVAVANSRLASSRSSSFMNSRADIGKGRFLCAGSPVGNGVVAHDLGRQTLRTARSAMSPPKAARALVKRQIVLKIDDLGPDDTDRRSLRAVPRPFEELRYAIDLVVMPATGKGEQFLQ